MKQVQVWYWTTKSVQYKKGSIYQSTFFVDGRCGTQRILVLCTEDGKKLKGVVVSHTNMEEVGVLLETADERFDEFHGTVTLEN